VRLGSDLSGVGADLVNNPPPLGGQHPLLPVPKVADQMAAVALPLGRCGQCLEPFVDHCGD
jgi:hypothetical protein